MVIDNKYSIGDFVYLATDVEQTMRLITAITIYPGGHLNYSLTLCTDTSEHYDFEITADENIEIKVK